MSLHYIRMILTNLGREPQYVIESKMSLAMAAQDHMAKIQDNDKPNGDGESAVLYGNGSFGGAGGGHLDT